jgi:hypothetical protein
LRGMILTTVCLNSWFRFGRHPASIDIETPKKRLLHYPENRFQDILLVPFGATQNRAEGYPQEGFKGVIWSILGAIWAPSRAKQHALCEHWLSVITNKANSHEQLCLHLLWTMLGRIVGSRRFRGTKLEHLGGHLGVKLKQVTSHVVIGFLL